MSQQLSLFQVVKWGPVQSVSKYFALLTIETALGRPLNEHTEARLRGCSTVEEIITRISQDDIEQVLHLISEEGRSRLGEIYIALRVEGRLAIINHRWYDIYSVSEHAGELKIEKIQVKTSYAPKSTQWAFDITNEKQETGYDVLVCVGLVDGLNPLEASVFVIPEPDLRPIIEQENAKGFGGRIRIQIQKQRYFRNSSSLNKLYEYQVRDHTQIKRIVSEHIHGDFIVILDR